MPACLPADAYILNVMFSALSLSHAPSKQAPWLAGLLMLLCISLVQLPRVSLLVAIHLSPFLSLSLSFSRSVFVWKFLCIVQFSFYYSTLITVNCLGLCTRYTPFDALWPLCLLTLLAGACCVCVCVQALIVHWSISSSSRPVMS